MLVGFVGFADEDGDSFDDADDEVDRNCGRHEQLVGATESEEK